MTSTTLYWILVANSFLLYIGILTSVLLALSFTYEILIVIDSGKTKFKICTDFKYSCILVGLLTTFIIIGSLIPNRADLILLYGADFFKGVDLKELINLLKELK